jgi:hypothetical protein
MGLVFPLVLDPVMGVIYLWMLNYATIVNEEDVAMIIKWQALVSSVPDASMISVWTVKKQKG